jgi:WD40 repeat protein
MHQQLMLIGGKVKNTSMFTFIVLLIGASLLAACNQAAASTAESCILPKIPIDVTIYPETATNIAPTPISLEVITSKNVQQVDLINKQQPSNVGLAFSPHGDILATGWPEGPGVRLYDLKTLNVMAELKTQIPCIMSVAFSPDGMLVAGGGGVCVEPGVCEAGVQIWNVANQEQQLLLDKFKNPVVSLAFSPDGTLLATGEGGGGVIDDPPAKLWNVTTGELLAEWGTDKIISPGYADVFGVAFNPDGTLLATANATGVAFNPDGTGTLAMTDATEGVQLWDVVNLKLKAVLRMPNAFGVAFSPDGTRLAASGLYVGERDSRVIVFDVAKQKRFNSFDLLKDLTTSIAFNHDGSLLASGSWDETVILWYLETGHEPVRLWDANARSVAFSPDGTLLATDGDVVRMWGVLHEDPDK